MRNRRRAGRRRSGWCAPSGSRSPRPTSLSAASSRSGGWRSSPGSPRFSKSGFLSRAAEVKQGDLLYQLEQPPFQAQVDFNKANVAQLEAQHRNAELTLERAQYLLKTLAGQQSNVDSALAQERALGGADRRRPGATANRRDQSRLYRDPRADRRQDQRHRGHRGQCRLADERDLGEPRQPGPDVRALPGLRARRARSAQPLRRQRAVSARS